MLEQIQILKPANQRYNPLHNVAYFDKIKLAVLLVDAGADINICPNGYTPLDIAISQNSLKVSTLLISLGALTKAQYDVKQKESECQPLFKLF